MSKVALKIHHYTSQELLGLLRKDEKFQQAIRLYACYQISEGKRPEELSNLYQVSFKSICNWVHRLNAGGIEALKDKPRSGRPARLNPIALSELKKMIINSIPEKHGYNTGTWTGPILIDYIKKTYKVEYKKAQIYNLLKGMGLSYQKSKGIYPEAKEREIKVVELKKTSNRKSKG
jgi:transposase